MLNYTYSFTAFLTLHIFLYCTIFTSQRTGTYLILLTVLYYSYCTGSTILTVVHIPYICAICSPSVIGFSDLFSQTQYNCGTNLIPFQQKRSYYTMIKISLDKFSTVIEVLVHANDGLFH